jgi:hypothetical protein
MAILSVEARGSDVVYLLRHKAVVRLIGGFTLSDLRPQSPLIARVQEIGQGIDIGDELLLAASQRALFGHLG